MQTLRAIYEQGRLRLLDPIQLTEGQVIQLMIVSERERAHAALADILVHNDASEVDESVDEASLLLEIDSEMDGKPTVSDATNVERREGP